MIRTKTNYDDEHKITVISALTFYTEIKFDSDVTCISVDAEFDGESI